MPNHDHRTFKILSIEKQSVIFIDDFQNFIWFNNGNLKRSHHFIRINCTFLRNSITEANKPYNHSTFHEQRIGPVLLIYFATFQWPFEIDFINYELQLSIELYCMHRHSISVIPNGFPIIAIKYIGNLWWIGRNENSASQPWFYRKASIRHPMWHAIVHASFHLILLKQR